MNHVRGQASEIANYDVSEKLEQIEMIKSGFESFVSALE
jgi:hypothetical protein